jgi:hypothetical protein
VHFSEPLFNGKIASPLPFSRPRFGAKLKLIPELFNFAQISEQRSDKNE